MIDANRLRQTKPRDLEANMIRHAFVLVFVSFLCSWLGGRLASKAGAVDSEPYT